MHQLTSILCVGVFLWRLRKQEAFTLARARRPLASVPVALRGAAVLNPIEGRSKQAVGVSIAWIAAFLYAFPKVATARSLFVAL
ncbi:MAG: hypothetical protein ACLSHJ_05860 [Oscillospiraceae bacterium]